jgi:hypothetical protein
LPALALAALVVGALLTAWWLGRRIPEESADFANLQATRLWFVLGAAMSGLSLAAGVIVVQPWWTCLATQMASLGPSRCCCP